MEWIAATALKYSSTGWFTEGKECTKTHETPCLIWKTLCGFHCGAQKTDTRKLPGSGRYNYHRNIFYIEIGSCCWVNYLENALLKRQRHFWVGYRKLPNACADWLSPELSWNSSGREEEMNVNTNTCEVFHNFWMKRVSDRKKSASQFDWSRQLFYNVFGAICMGIWNEDLTKIIAIN